MPILSIEIIGEVQTKLQIGLAERIANSAGVVLNSRPQGTWVKLHFLPEDQYSENEGGPPEGALPIFVSLIQAELPTGKDLGVLVSALTDTIADCAGRPRENVHIIIEPPAKGRITFGGNLKQ